jgi:hypothetical protein
LNCSICRKAIIWRRFQVKRISMSWTDVTAMWMASRTACCGKPVMGNPN